MGKNIFESVVKNIFESVGKNIYESVGKNIFGSVGKNIFESVGKNIFETRPTQRLCADQTVISDFSDGAMRPVPTWGLFPQEFIASSDDLLDEFLVSSLPRE